jgi:hypothetical protein
MPEGLLSKDRGCQDLAVALAVEQQRLHLKPL